MAHCMTFSLICFICKIQIYLFQYKRTQDYLFKIFICKTQFYPLRDLQLQFKSEFNALFDVSMGSFFGAELCDLRGFYVLATFSPSIKIMKSVCTEMMA